jgi:hypothetical protein
MDWSIYRTVVAISTAVLFVVVIGKLVVVILAGVEGCCVCRDIYKGTANIEMVAVSVGRNLMVVG